MAYSYRYIPSSILAHNQKASTPKDGYKELFQETLNEQFYNASTWWTIQEETYSSSGIYEELDARVAHVINAETGLKLGDDWKTILFKDLDHPVELGRFYIFDESTWLTTNTEYIKNLTGTCTVRRCNNTLRWIDEPTGIYYEEACCIEYLVKEPRDYYTQGSAFTTPGGFVHIETQFNSKTKNIKENQRFLFGNPNHWTCYKVIGTGINDFRNIQTYDNESARILTLDLVANFVNDDLDDTINGIANANKNPYTISINRDSVSGSPSGKADLVSSITYKGLSVTRYVEWESSNTNVATVSGSSGSCTVSFVSNGSSVITGTIYGNPTSASCLVTVSASPIINYDIIISPDENYVLEGDTKSYTVYLYENSVQQADIFTITCNGSAVPSTSYTFQQTSGNGFSIKNNLKDVESYLIITCVSGSYSSTYDIYLKGAW